MELAHGPWKEIFKGKWNGYDCAIYSNPEMLTFTTISDKTGTGFICLLNKYYMVEGNISNFARGLSGYSMIFEKHYPTIHAKYLSISTGPLYALYYRFCFSSV